MHCFDNKVRYDWQVAKESISILPSFVVKEFKISKNINHEREYWRVDFSAHDILEWILLIWSIIRAKY